MGSIYLFDNKKKPYIHSYHSDVIQLGDYHKNLVKSEVIEIIDILEDYGISCELTDSEIDCILDVFYEYYVEKGIIHEFPLNMIHHFRDIQIAALEQNECFDVSFVLAGLELYEFFESPVEIEPQDTRELVLKLHKLFDRKGC